MDLAAVVVLPLVVLPPLQARDAAPGAGDAEADFEEEPAVMPPPGLGAQDRRPRVRVGGGEESFEAFGRGRCIVVDQPDPLRGLDIEGLIAVRPEHSRGEAGGHRRTESRLGVGEGDDAIGTE